MPAFFTSATRQLVHTHTHTQDAAGPLLPERKVGGLGPLGEFLLGKWQEEVISEQALLVRGSQVSK